MNGHNQNSKSEQNEKPTPCLDTENVVIVDQTRVDTQDTVTVIYENNFHEIGKEYWHI